MWVYILLSEKTKKHYIGYTSDLRRRLNRHNSGLSRWTRSGMPWKVVYKEKCASKIDAIRRERLIKSYKGGNAFKKLLLGGVA